MYLNWLLGAWIASPAVVLGPATFPAAFVASLVREVKRV